MGMRVISRDITLYVTALYAFDMSVRLRMLAWATFNCLTIAWQSLNNPDRYRKSYGEDLNDQRVSVP
jgi:hypothetical protein